MSWINIAAKAVGAVGMGLVAYDAHKAGCINADSHSKKVTSGFISEGYIDSNMMSTPSTVNSKLKKGWFKLKMEDNSVSFFSGIGGYLRGFGSMLVDSAIPLALATATLLTKGKISKFSALGLVGYGAYSLLTELCSFSKTPRLDKNY